MKISLAGKKVLITGASRGIGRAIAQAVHACGGHVIAVSRTQADLDALAAELAGISTIVCDVSDWDATRRAMEPLQDVDCLVNNAGRIVAPDDINIANAEAIDQTFDLNLKAAINLSQMMGKRMAARGTGGCIVNISSIASYRVLKGLHVYSASKAALDQVTRILAVELGPSNVRVNCVNPTLVKTDMARQFTENTAALEQLIAQTPLRRVAEVEDVANTVVFLLSDQACYLNGVVLPIDGGITAA